ncbi:hypothetical protein ILYODFUR_000619 [Ilyodon furcidens]|uniref:Secreted protein n=1 Tax=Ilyodon furcidens TaxID=33524 RepID=A0ABV0TQR5_9TELE
MFSSCFCSRPPLLASFPQYFVCHLGPLLHLILLLVQCCCFSASVQSLSLSAFTYPPLSDVTHVFHFIPSSCSLSDQHSVIKKYLPSRRLCLFATPKYLRSSNKSDTTRIQTDSSFSKTKRGNGYLNQLRPMIIHVFRKSCVQFDCLP